MVHDSIKGETNKMEENQWKTMKEPFKKSSPWRQVHTKRFYPSFQGYFFVCNQFGYKEIYYILNDRNKYKHRTMNYGAHARANPTRKKIGRIMNRNINYFTLLMNLDIICYMYNNFRHLVIFYRSSFLESPKQNTEVEQKKEENSKVWKKREKSMIFQTTLHDRNERDQWYIDSGCSRHRRSDKSKFITLKRVNGGIIRFGDNASTRISRRGSLSLDNGRTRIQNVLYVEGLKHNILSVSQLCDQWNILTFHVEGCEISKEGKLQNSVEQEIIFMFLVTSKVRNFVWENKMRFGYGTK